MSESDAVAPAVQRVTDYLVAWGIGKASARRWAHALDTRIDPEGSDPSSRTAAMIETFDGWTDGLAEQLQMPGEADRIALVVAKYGAPLLDAHPEALDQPDAFLDALRGHLEVWEHGTLPKLEHLEMHRQPLGDLPMVLRGEFWSGTYRWVMPSSERVVRRIAGNNAEIDTPAAEPAPPAPPGPATT